MDPWLGLLVVVTVLVGALSQRLAGLGFALVAAPVVVLALGPLEGVTLVNSCSVVASAIILVRVWHQVEWRRFRVLLGWSFLGIIPGALLVQVASVPILEVAIGSLVILGISASLVASRFRAIAGDGHPLALAGMASGFLSATAGIGGAALGTYAILTRWPQSAFVATAQPFFVLISLSSIITRHVVGGASWPSLDPWMWVGVVGALLAGLVLADALSAVVKPLIARRIMTALAIGGGVTAMLKGIGSLIG